MANNDLRIRGFVPDELRSEEEDGSPVIIGHAAVFNALSEPIRGFKERIAPGAFKKTLQEADVRAFFNHDPKFVLGRRSSGTLEVSEDEIGLAVKIKPPNTQTVRDLVLEPMRRGDIDKMSFAFLPVRNRDLWLEEDGWPVVTRQEVKLVEVSPVSLPAYPQTDASVRSADIEAGDKELDFLALSVIIAKREHNFDLSDNERDLLQRAIEQLGRYLPVAPEAAAHHPTNDPASPPIDMETLRRRLKIAKHPRWAL